MKYYFITGTSSGIGEALANELLKKDDALVYGFSRRNSISHERYHHTNIDLGEIKELTAFKFPELNDADQITLVNNAGTLGKVSHIGTLDAGDLARTFMVNLSSVAILTNSFTKAYQSTKCNKVVMNISSGAGKSPIDGWSIYCSSKAGLDMFSKVYALEQEFMNSPIRCFSVAPGIVDTAMQREIRKIKKEDFSRIEDFIRYKERGELADPALISQKLILILDKPEEFNETILSVRDF
jgi:benzil reductase ((S)-benzoin forming)